MRYTFESLHIVGYRDERVPNTFLRQEGRTLRTMERVLRHVEAFIRHRPSPE